jgi:putative hydrolases of HD superfamily
MEKLLRFIELTRKFRAVKRKVVFADDKCAENDAEHSFQLAVTAWYIVSANKLKLDTEKVLQYALAHDLVEAYAGDTPASVHRSYEVERGTKKMREEEAAERIQEEFEEFDNLHEVIKGYEERADDESKFVYALDKLMPVLNIYLDKGYSWKLNDVRLEDVINYKSEQIAESPAVDKYFKEIIPLLKELPGLS